MFTTARPLERVATRVTAAERAALEREARSEDRTVSYVLRRLIREHVGHGEKVSR